MAAAVHTVAVSADPIVPAYVTTEGAAAYTALAVSTLETMRGSGGGPRYIKVGRAIRYRIADLDRFMAAQPTGGGG